MELIARRVIVGEEGQNVSRDILMDYCNPDTDRYHKMLEGICKQMGFTSLSYNRLDDMLEACRIDRSKLCTYCWNGKE
jgi:amidophosphoribosyltransferase